MVCTCTHIKKVWISLLSLSLSTPISTIVPHLILPWSTSLLRHKRVAVVTAQRSAAVPRVAVLAVPPWSSMSYRTSGGRTHEIDQERETPRPLKRCEKIQSLIYSNDNTAGIY